MLPPHGGHAPCLAQRPSAPPLWCETKSRRREGSDFSGSNCGGEMSTHLFPNRPSSDAPALLPSPVASHSLLASPLSAPSASPYATGRVGKKRSKKKTRAREGGRRWGTGWQADKERGRGGWQPGTRGLCQALLGSGMYVRSATCTLLLPAALPCPVLCALSPVPCALSPQPSAPSLQPGLPAPAPALPGSRWGTGCSSPASTKDRSPCHPCHPEARKFPSGQVCGSISPAGSPVLA